MIFSLGSPRGKVKEERSKQHDRNKGKGERAKVKAREDCDSGFPLLAFLLDLP
jgi:hypothetical protein